MYISLVELVFRVAALTGVSFDLFSCFCVVVAVPGYCSAKRTIFKDFTKTTPMQEVKSSKPWVQTRRVVQVPCQLMPALMPVLMPVLMPALLLPLPPAAHLAKKASSTPRQTSLSATQRRCLLRGHPPHNRVRVDRLSGRASLASKCK